MNWALFAIRVGVWIAASMYVLYLVRNPTPSFDELIAGLPLMLLLTCIPGGLFLWLIRTWPGTLLASIGFVGGWIALFLYISAEGERSSTAGINLLGLPFVTVLPILLVAGVEQATMPKPPPPLPPPPAPHGAEPLGQLQGCFTGSAGESPQSNSAGIGQAPEADALPDGLDQPCFLDPSVPGHERHLEGLSGRDDEPVPRVAECVSRDRDSGVRDSHVDWM